MLSTAENGGISLIHKVQPFRFISFCQYGPFFSLFFRPKCECFPSQVKIPMLMSYNGGWVDGEEWEHAVTKSLRGAQSR